MDDYVKRRKILLCVLATVAILAMAILNLEFVGRKAEYLPKSAVISRLRRQDGESGDGVTSDPSESADSETNPAFKNLLEQIFGDIGVDVEVDDGSGEDDRTEPEPLEDKWDHVTSESQEVGDDDTDDEIPDFSSTTENHAETTDGGMERTTQSEPTTPAWYGYTDDHNEAIYLGNDIVTVEPSAAIPESSSTKRTSPAIIDNGGSFCDAALMINDFCILPDELGETLGWDVTLSDIYEKLFDNFTIQSLVSDCPTGSWCLDNITGVERLLEYWTDSDRFGYICWPGLGDCIRDMVEYYNECDQFEELDLMSSALYTMCDVTKMETASACVRETLTSLQITMADISRPPTYQSGTIEYCETTESKMAANLQCLVLACPDLRAIFFSNAFWLPLKDRATLTNECFTTSTCDARPQDPVTTGEPAEPPPGLTTFQTQSYPYVSTDQPVVSETQSQVTESQEWTWSSEVPQTNHDDTVTEDSENTTPQDVSTIGADISSSIASHQQGSQQIMTDAVKVVNVGMMVGIGLSLAALLCVVVITVIVFRRRRRDISRNHFRTGIEYTQILNEQ